MMEPEIIGEFIKLLKKANTYGVRKATSSIATPQTFEYYADNCGIELNLSDQTDRSSVQLLEFIISKLDIKKYGIIGPEEYF